MDLRTSVTDQGKAALDWLWSEYPQIAKAVTGCVDAGISANMIRSFVIRHCEFDRQRITAKCTLAAQYLIAQKEPKP